jgi:thioredoxin 1
MAAFSEIIASKKPILIDFYADWCNPCKILAPELEKLASLLQEEVKIIKINVDKNPTLAENLQVRGVPTLMLYQNSQLLWRESGVRNAQQLKSIIETYKM